MVFFLQMMLAVSKMPSRILGKDIFLWGYFQDVSFLESNSEINKLLDSFCNIEKNTNAQINSDNNKIGISVRCGEDFVANKYPICNLDYYQKAIDYFQQIYRNITFVVFSDDINKAKKVLPKEVSYIFVENSSPIEDLIKMRTCNHFIISNSSFSWWGAYLGTNDSKKVIFPEKWDRYGNTKDTKLLYDGCEILE